jgi:hypothetical protein
MPVPRRLLSEREELRWLLRSCGVPAELVDEQVAQMMEEKREKTKAKGRRK